MSQPTQAPTPPPPDATIMKRLGYVRLLHRQAVELSYAPAPLNFSAVLAFHDVMEYFFIVAVAHMGRGQDIDIKRPLSETVLKLKAPDGGGVSCVDALRRTAHDRNGFKHNGSVPGPDQVEHARRDAAEFLEANCSRFFGIGFGNISMLHIVPQQQVRDLLKAGRAAADAGDVRAAMSQMALAFHYLMDGWGNGKGIPDDGFQRSGFDLSPFGGSHYRHRIDVYAEDQGMRSAVRSLADAVTREFKETDKELEALRHVLRIQMSGIDTARYIRFAMLAPRVSISANGKADALDGIGALHYTLVNYEFCENFIVDSALRLAAGDFEMWMPVTFNDAARAQEAAKANGGVLPDGWAG